MPAPTITEGKSYRPSQEFLDVFWTLSEGNDQQRNECATKLGNMINSLTEEEEKEKILSYCRERLIKGLSSGRKFARVGFSVALTQLLRQFSEVEAKDILNIIQEKLKVVKSDKKSKSEVGGIYLGRAFAYSSMIQSGYVKQMNVEALLSIVDELLTISEKKSYLKPVCSRTMEDLMSQVSADTFGDHVWPRLRDVMKQGWESCTLDKLSLFITCREKFPDVVNKKFVKKHWGYPLLGEENDDKLLSVILEMTKQKKEAVLLRLFEIMLKKRDITAVWSGIGDKLMAQLPDKKVDMMHQRHLLGLQVATQLVSISDSTEQTVDLILSPNIAIKVFHNHNKKHDPIVTQADELFDMLRQKLDAKDVKEVLKRIWKLDSELPEGQVGKVDLLGSTNFGILADMLETEDAIDYSNTLVEIVKGVNECDVLSSKPSKRSRQVENALRQLHHLACSQRYSSATLQKSVLGLLLRLAWFHVVKKSKSIDHCETITNFELDSSTRKLCEALFFKALDQLSTMKNPDTQPSSYTHTMVYGELLFFLGEFFQNLLKSPSVKAVKDWDPGLIEEWERLFAFATKIKSEIDNVDHRHSAFLLLGLFLGFHMLTDYKSAVDLLQEVYVCYEKALADPWRRRGGKSLPQSKSDHVEQEEPSWVEVLTEVLLSLLSLQSHLGRVVTAMVFGDLMEHLTTPAIQLITEVLIPKSLHKDDVLVAEDNEDDMEEEDDDDDDGLLDEDVPDEESDDDDDDDDDDENENGENGEAEEEEGMEEDEEEEEEEQVDTEFRKKIKEALGTAAVDSEDEGNNENDEDEDEEDLPDLSDSEMFKLDDMLAEVFRQRKKAGSGKKGREEKQRETANFRARVLDLVEVLVKGSRCGDFALDLMKPLLLLTFKMKQPSQRGLLERSKSLLKQMKSKNRSLQDSVHTTDELVDFYQELVDLAHSVTDVSHLQDVSNACHIVMVLASKRKESKMGLKRCLDVLKQALETIVKKSHSKLHISFFTSMIELEPWWYQGLASSLIDSLGNPDIKLHGKMVSASILSSLTKKLDVVGYYDKQRDAMTTWMPEAANVVAQVIQAMDKKDIKVMVAKDVLSLGVAMTARTDITLDKPLFTTEVKEHLTELRPKFNTDLRRLANKLITAIDKSHPQAEKSKKNKKKKKRNSESEEAPPPKKKQKS